MQAKRKEHTVATKFGEIYTRPRYFKRGDVIRRTPTYGSDPTGEIGVGIVIESQGPRFKAFWTKVEEIRHGDALLPGQYCLVDSAPLMEAVELIEKKVLAS